MKLSVICAIGNQARFERCLAKSIEPQIRPGDEFLTEQGTDSLAATYKRLESRATNPVCIFIHEDVVTPSPWLEHFRSILTDLESRDRGWGLLGVSGTDLHPGPHENMQDFVKSQFYIVNVRDRTPEGPTDNYRLAGALGILHACPMLDSIVIAKKRNDSIQWDPKIPGFAAGTAEDLCIQAAMQKRGIYCFPTYIEHETVHNDQQSEAFKTAKKYIVNKWRHVRPIVTTAGVWV